MSERNRRRWNAQHDTAEDDLKQRLVKENEALKQARLNKQERINKIKSDRREKLLKKLRSDVPVLYIGPFVPCILAVVTICLCSITRNLGNNCQGAPLKTYLLTCQITAYIFMFGFACMYIGQPCNVCGLTTVDLSCKKLRSVNIFFGFMFVSSLGINAFGLVSLLGASAECSESAPLLYGTTIWQVSTYWLTAIGSIVYVVKHKIQGRTNKKKVIAVDYSATEEENEEGGEGDEEEFGREEDEEEW